VAALATQVATLAAEVVTLTTEVATNTANIATNTANIATLTARNQIKTAPAFRLPGLGNDGDLYINNTGQRWYESVRKRLRGRGLRSPSKHHHAVNDILKFRHCTGDEVQTPGVLPTSLEFGLVFVLHAFVVFNSIANLRPSTGNTRKSATPLSTPSRF